MASVSDYFSIDKVISEAITEKKLSFERSMNLAIISSSTVNGLDQILRVQCGEFDLLTSIYVSGYNQFAQEILDPKSGLFLSEPELVFINIDIKTIANEMYFNPYESSKTEREKWAEETKSFLINLAQEVAKKSNAKVILHNFEIPYYSPLGLVENKNSFGFIESIEKINQGLREQFKLDNQVYLFDYNSFCGRYGKENIFDEKMYYLGDIKLKPKFLPFLCKEYARYVKAAALLTKKCIVLDLDNTLWGGVLGEDGIERIHLGPTPQGKPFSEFQQQLLALYNRGVILAINSKNNFEEAIEAIKSHPHMLLKEKHFAAMRINWDDKVSNLKSLAKEINIGLDSMVFIDDDGFNREMVRQFLPEVEILELPKDSALYSRMLMDVSLFDSFTLTKEDITKGQMYSHEKQRRTLMREVSNVSDYLKMLDMRLDISPADIINIPRIAQLTQKTNQFNMTTKRYTDEDIRDFLSSGTHRIYTLQLIDKFGDYGLTGLAIIDTTAVWRIDTFLLSCRILGRHVEEAFFTYIAQEANKEGGKYLIGEFIQTEKNNPAKDFYKNMGLKEYFENEIKFWKCNLSKTLEFPDYFKLFDQ